MKSPDHLLGYKLKAAREDRMLTQERLAELVGITPGYLSEIENKKTIPSFMILCSLCRILNLSLDDIVYHTESNTARNIMRLVSQCNEKQLIVIQSMIEAMLKAELYI